MRTTPSPLTRLVSTEASTGIQTIRKTFFGSNALKLIDPPNLTKNVDDYGSPLSPALGLENEIYFGFRFATSKFKSEVGKQPYTHIFIRSF